MKHALSARVMKHTILSLITGLALLYGWAVAQAQAFPSRPLTLIVPFPPGGGPDLAARVFAEKLAPRLGQPVVVENRPGAGALVGASAVAKASGDGHTLLFTPNTVVISPHVLPSGAGGGLDVQRDLIAVIAPVTNPMVLVASPQLGANSLKAALELMRKTPGLPYGSAGNGSPMHFAGEMFKRSGKVDLLHVPYRGVAPSINAALSGEVKLLFTGLGGALQFIKAGKLVALAVTERTRSEMMPEVPTATEQGLPGVEVEAWYGVFAPKGTPVPVITRLNQDFNAVLQMPDVRSKLTAAGLELLGGTPQQLDDLVKADHQRYGTLASELKIKVD
jgi:tripartite-type tricarboxylate transporter receptor subunit TctC